MLPCLSCKEEVNPAEAKLFAQVLLCPLCFVIAERLYKKGESELRMMLLVLKESIRVAALKGELGFSLQNLDDMDKQDLLTHQHELATEARKAATSTPWTTSKDSTQPPALPAAGEQS